MKVKKMKNINDKEAAVYAEESIVSTHDVLSKDDLYRQVSRTSNNQQTLIDNHKN